MTATMPPCHRHLLASVLAARCSAERSSRRTSQPDDRSSPPILRPGPGRSPSSSAAPGSDVRLLVGGDAVDRRGHVDLAGSLLFRNLEPGAYTVEIETSTTPLVERVDRRPGLRRATTPGLLRRPADRPRLRLPDGPRRHDAERQRRASRRARPTVRSRRSSSTPATTRATRPAPASGLSALATALGYAWVGVNMRGSGCSGGSFDYFEPIQATDGYDAIEAIAAQPWVQGNKVGMVGISYSGISQLYVAATQPPSLLAITPLSVVDSSALYTLYPGGILNDGFALDWAHRARRGDRARSARRGRRTRIDAGDDGRAATNQLLRLQNPGLEAQIRDNPFYSDAATQDRRPTAARRHRGAGVPRRGLAGRADRRALRQHARRVHRHRSVLRLADQRPAHRVALGRHRPTLARVPRPLRRRPCAVAGHACGAIAPVLGDAIWETDQITLARRPLHRARRTTRRWPPSRPTSRSRCCSRRAPAAPMPLAPMPGVESSRSRPGRCPDAVATAWYLGADGTLGSRHRRSRPVDDVVRRRPEQRPRELLRRGRRRQHLVGRRRVRLGRRAAGHGGQSSCPSRSPRDTIVMGSGSADLWISADAPDTDVEVTIIEVRPDGTEVLVQSGWLRASHRALDEAASTALHPGADAPRGRCRAAAGRRAGADPRRHLSLRPSVPRRLATAGRRSTLPAATARSGYWDTISDGETVTIAHDVDHPSRIVLSTLTGIDIPDDYPACGIAARPTLPPDVDQAAWRSRSMASPNDRKR